MWAEGDEAGNEEDATQVGDGEDLDDVKEEDNDEKAERFEGRGRSDWDLENSVGD